MEIVVFVLVVLLIVLNIADVWTTLKVLSQGGSEQNRFVRKLMERFGKFPGLVGGKVVFVTPIVVVSFLWPCPLVIIALLALVWIYARVVWNNWGQIKKS